MAIVDCKYKLQNKDGTTSKMWSTFIAVSDKGIRKNMVVQNMLPSVHHFFSNTSRE
jgi:hypothetical protein